MKRFALIGAAGYVAPRHMKAIADIGGDLVAALDPHDSVGVLDRFFPNCRFFAEFERFDRFCSDRSIDYVSICSPNYLHDAHCRFAMRIGADAICEKPLCLTMKNLYRLGADEKRYSRKINVILQLRLHPEAVRLKQALDPGTMYQFTLGYVTPRGPWYHYSWKGDVTKSGGLATNIGVHLLDLLGWLFGGAMEVDVTSSSNDSVVGAVNLLRAKGVFKLSVANGQRHAHRFLDIVTEEGQNPLYFEFNGGFEDLHTKSYQEIINENGFGVADVQNVTWACQDIRIQCQ